MGALLPDEPGDRLFVFLFTDIEGSTVRWETHPAAMRVALARHDALLRGSFEQHGGHVFKAVGDAFCVAFANASAAIAAAVAATQALSREDTAAVGEVRVRIGIHAGPAERRDGDYFGPTLNRVARLMSIAHGGQIVISGAAAGLARGTLPPGIALRDLGLHRLKDLAEPEHVFQIEAPGLGAAFPPLHSLSARPNNLPLQGSPIVGRETALAEVGSLLRSCRLVTLAGSGGVGKTRLEIQVAAELLDHYPDGVWLVELAPLADPELVAETVADIFNLPSTAVRGAAEAVIGFLKHKTLLLILDNCEHLVAAAAALADSIIKLCPHVTVLASSREPLQIAAERVYRLATLDIPSATERITAAEALQSSATALFVERARAALGHYVLTDADAPIVAAICRRLDGIALAIELAAPRLKILKPAQLLEKLNDRFRLLTGGSRTALPRQQTLRALVDWSYNLLSAPEKALMRRLAVFADSWTLESAAAVAAGDQIDDWAVLDLLASLVDKSLVVADHSGDETRYRFLETTRDYAAAKLVEAGEGAWPGHLAAYLVSLLRGADAEWYTTPSATWRARYAPELDNLRSAIDWAFAAGGNKDLGLALVAYSDRLWVELSHLVEMRRRVGAAVAHLGDTTPPEIAARLYLRLRSADAAEQVGILRRAIDLARQTSDSLHLALALVALAEALHDPPDFAEPLRLLEEALALVRPYGQTKALGRALLVLGGTMSKKGDLRAAREAHERGLISARATGDLSAISLLLSGISVAWSEEGDMARAIEAAREAAAIANGAANRVAEMGADLLLAGYAAVQGNPAEALQFGIEGLRHARDLGQHARVPYALLSLAHVAASHGDAEAGARLQGFVDGYYAANNLQYIVIDGGIADLTRTALAATLEPADLHRLAAEGRALAVEDAISLGLSIGPRSAASG